MAAKCVVLYDAQTEPLGAWVTTVCRTKLGHLFSSVVHEQTTEAQYVTRAQALDATATGALAAVHTDPNAQDVVQPVVPVTVVVVAFWDGVSDAAKAVFGEFKAWAANRKTTLVVQALNAKKGHHTLMENEDALVSSITKKLPAASAAANQPKKAQPGDDGLLSDDRIELELTPEKVALRLRQGQGECFWVISASADAFAGAVAALQDVARALECGMFAVTPEPRPLAKQPDAGAASAAAGSGPQLAQEFMLRQRREMEHIEMRVAMCGNVDSGKSTVTSVLTRGVRDDGRGLARTFVFNHKHEADTGRTSSVSENHLGFDSDGTVVNYDNKTVAAIAGTLRSGAGPNPSADAAPAVDPSAAPTKHERVVHMSTHDLALKSSKVLTLYDLAGHEKYLKTTVLGMTRSMPDYACIVISANNGIQRMTKEHLGLCLALKLPFFVVVTRIDATPDNVRQETLQTILKMLKMPTVKKLPYPVKKPDDVIVAAKNLQYDRITPLFEVSNVTGQGIADVLQFMNLLPVRKDWGALVHQPREMIIDSTFFVTGVGTVVGGIITQGRFRTGDTVWLGPDGLGAFRLTQLKSIHVKGVEVDHVDAGNDAAICLKKEKRSAVRKGNVLVEATDPKHMPSSYWQFEAEIVILYHSTTISTNYEPVIHSTTVRQSARIMLVEQEVLRTGDRSTVRFHFLYRPEFMQVGQRLIFREGRTKGIGTVTKLIEGQDESFLSSTRKRNKETVRATHNLR